eukprot:gene16370-26883_t
MQPFAEDQRLVGEADGTLTLQLSGTAEVLLLRPTQGSLKLHAIAPRTAGCGVMVRSTAYSTCRQALGWPEADRKKGKRHTMAAITLRSMHAASDEKPPELPEEWKRVFTPGGQ